MQIDAIALVAGLALTALPLALPEHQDEPDAAPVAVESLRTQPVEIGTVAWLRDLAAAKAESARTNKPILALFQEVPG